MRVPATALGLGAVTYGAPVLPSEGVSLEVAARACGIAKGVWDGMGCSLPDTVVPPTWCDWVPFSGLMAECQLPAASDFAASGSFTAYKIAQKDTAAIPAGFVNGQMVPDPSGGTTTGVDAAAIIMRTSGQQSSSLVSAAGCEYETAANHPWLAQMVGPTIACGLVNPFDSQHYGWVMYLVAGVGLFLAVSALRGRG